MSTVNTITMPAHLRRLLPAAVLAATATLGGSAFGDPATACAEPKPWNEAGYTACVDQLNADLAKGRYTQDQYIELVRGCCILSGGVWNEPKRGCEAAAAQPAQDQPGVAPPPEGATQNPEPPPPVTRVPPGVIETFTPAPIG
jgi:hypothetical protein